MKIIVIFIFILLFFLLLIKIFFKLKYYMKKLRTRYYSYDSEDEENLKNY